MKRLFLPLCLGFYVIPSFSAVLPAPSNYDRRIQTVVYNPDDVVRIKTKVGISTLIQLEQGEQANDPNNGGFGIGDSNAWKIAIRGNNIFIKPTEKNPNTNVTLVTNKRTYIFSLELTNATPSYMVRFVYPKPKEKPKLPNYLLAQQNKPCNDSFGYKNYRYMKWGDNIIAPYEAWDDGRFTCFRFSGSVELPVIYKKLSDGTEVLTNSHLEGDVVVVHEVTKEYRFRLGEKVLGVKSSINPASFFNYKGTSTKNEREIKGNNQ